MSSRKIPEWMDVMSPEYVHFYNDVDLPGSYKTFIPDCAEVSFTDSDSGSEDSEVSYYSDYFADLDLTKQVQVLRDTITVLHQE